MTEAYQVVPDGDFIRRARESGGGDLKRCYQCATCAVVCPLADEEHPFPRKEMVWAQWGLKDRLMADPDLWRCHYCNDCSTRCPRGARPGDTLAAVRQEFIRHYAVPQGLTGLLNKPAFLPVLLAVPALLLGLALLLRDPVASVLGFEPHVGQGMEYAHLFPHWLLIGFFTFFSGVAGLIVAVGALRYWKAMREADTRAGRTVPGRGLIASAIQAGLAILTHGKFRQCDARPARQWAHMGVFYGFAALFIVTIWAVLVIYVINPLFDNPFVYPFVWWNPMKVFANLGALALIAGCILAIRDRLRAGKDTLASSAFDWMFLWTLFGVGVTGVVVELLRYASIEGAGYVIYFIHLILVFALLVYLPYTKFAHMVYRLTAMVYAGQTWRSAGQPAAAPAPEKPQEAVAGGAAS